MNHEFSFLVSYLSRGTAFFSRLPGGQRITLAGKRREKKEEEMKKMFKNEIKEVLTIIKNSQFYCRLVIEDWEGAEDSEEITTTQFYFEKESGKWYETIIQPGYAIENRDNVSEDEIIRRLQNLGEDESVFISPNGTHCGSLKFVFGWVHEKKVTQEEITEAVMPQRD